VSRETSVHQLATEAVHSRPNEAILWIEQLEQEVKVLKHYKTLRDEFAMAALQGMVVGHVRHLIPRELDVKFLADQSYKVADAMLAAREAK